MKQLEYIFRYRAHTPAITLMLLGVVEQAPRHSIGCEGFLGWWPREDEQIPIGASELDNQLLKLLMQKQGHDVASLTTYVLHRMRVYEVASKYECVVLSVLEGVSITGKVSTVNLDMLASAKLQLKKLFEEMFIGLLLRAMKNDINLKRVCAFAKRLLQVALQQPPQYACGCIFLPSEVLKARPPLWNMVLQNESADDEEIEHFEHIVEEAENNSETGADKTYSVGVVVLNDADTDGDNSEEEGGSPNSASEDEDW